MRKLMSIMLTLILLFTASSSFAEAPTSIQVKVNNETVFFPDAQPYLDNNNRTMVPIRFVAETLGAEVEWFGKDSSIVIRLADKEIRFRIGENIIKVNGQLRQIDTVTVLKDSRTFVPVRFVSEGLGYQVEWTNNTVLIVESTVVKNPSQEPSGGTNNNAAVPGEIVYVKPTESKIIIEIFDKSKPENADKVDWIVTLDTRLDLAPQHLQTKAFLQERFDSSTVSKIMEYISAKTHDTMDLPFKFIELPGNKIVTMSSNVSSPLISISSFIKNW